MGLGGCDAGPKRANSKNLTASLRAFAFQSQTLELQASHLARRFGLPASVAALVAQHAFKTEARQ
jgi:hypothetical protein